MNRQLVYLLIIVAGIVCGVGFILWLIFGASNTTNEFDPTTLRPLVEKGQWVSPDQEKAEKYRSLLKSSAPTDRLIAIAQLGEMRDTKSMPQLLDLMADPDVTTRIKAGIAVRKILDTDLGFRGDAPP